MCIVFTVPQIIDTCETYRDLASQTTPQFLQTIIKVLVILVIKKLEKGGFLLGG